MSFNSDLIGHLFLFRIGDLAEDSETWITQLPESTDKMQTSKMAEDTEPWIARSPDLTGKMQTLKRKSIIDNTIMSVLIT